VGGSFFGTLEYTICDAINANDEGIALPASMTAFKNH